jgi:co-chaperonin GroES (HSP10)
LSVSNTIIIAPCFIKINIITGTKHRKPSVGAIVAAGKGNKKQKSKVVIKTVKQSDGKHL